MSVEANASFSFTHHAETIKDMYTRSSFHVYSEFYKQIDGVAMGSPLGLLFANWFLKDYASKFIENDHHKLGI